MPDIGSIDESSSFMFSKMIPESGWDSLILLPELSYSTLLDECYSLGLSNSTSGKACMALLLTSLATELFELLKGYKLSVTGYAVL
jgi:hypothetical protein